MAKRRRRSRKKKSPAVHRRRRRARKSNPNLFAPKRRRRSRRRARRRNPSGPKMGMGKLFAPVLIGGVGGLAVSYAVDKLNVGRPQPRNLGIIALGALAAFVGKKMKKPMGGALVGAGVAGVGLTRLVATQQLNNPTSAAIRGLGTGEGLDADIQSPFDQAMSPGIGLVQPGISGVYDDMGNSDVEGMYDIGLVQVNY